MTNIFRRRLLGKFSKDYKTFSGKSLVAGKMPFSFEYFDDQQFVVDAEARQLMKYLGEIREEFSETRKTLVSIEKSVNTIKNTYDATDEKLKVQIKELQHQITELQKQVNEINNRQRISKLQLQIDELRTQIENLDIPAKEQAKATEPLEKTKQE